MSTLIKYTFLAGLFIFSACSIIFDDDISDEIIEIIMPLDNTILSDSVSLFWWEPVTGAVDYSFHLIEGNFSSPIKLIIDTIVITESLQVEVDPGIYQWRIRANGINESTKYQLYSLEIILDAK